MNERRRSDCWPLIFSGLALIAAIATPAIGNSQQDSRYEMLERRILRLEEFQEAVTLDLKEMAGDVKSINKSLEGVARFLDKWTK